MRIVSFNGGKAGIIVNDKVLDVSKALKGINFRNWANYKYVRNLIEQWNEIEILLERILKNKHVIECFSYNLNDVSLDAPITNPSKIICVGRNYMSHIEEMQEEVPSEPIFFLKPPSALTGHNSKIILPTESERIDHEIELAVIIGKRCKNVDPREAWNTIFGYTILLDITARDLQKKDVTWFRAKGFDTFCPLGPWIVTKDEIEDPQNLNIELKVNGEVRQRGNTKDMIFKINELISFASKVCTLEPGDIIATGTPKGVAPLKHGDIIEGYIEKIGSLKLAVNSFP